MNLIGYSFFICLALPALRSGDSHSVKVIVLAGQSNMEGKAPNTLKRNAQGGFRHDHNLHAIAAGNAINLRFNGTGVSINEIVSAKDFYRGIGMRYS